MKRALLLCLALMCGDADAARTLYNGFTGTWWNPSRSGEGVFIHELQNDTLIVAWFTYDPANPGKQLYLVGSAAVTDDTVAVDVVSTSGGVFGTDFNPALVQRPPWGRLTLALVGCETLNLTYSPSGGTGGTIQLQRILPMTSALCEPVVALAGQRYEGVRTFRIVSNPATSSGCLSVTFPSSTSASFVLNASGNMLTLDYDNFFDKQCRFQGGFSRRDNAVFSNGNYLCSNGFIGGTWTSSNIRLGAKYVEIDVDLTNTDATCSQALKFRAVVPPP